MTTQKQLTKAQVEARIAQVQTFLMKRFPDFGYCLLVAHLDEKHGIIVHSNSNLAGRSMRHMLRGYATQHEDLERQLSEPAGHA